MVVSGNSSRVTGVSYALRPRKRLTAASISSTVAGDNRTIQSSVWTRSLPSHTDLPLGRYGGWNVIGISSNHQVQLALRRLRRPFAGSNDLKSIAFPRPDHRVSAGR